MGEGEELALSFLVMNQTPLRLAGNISLQEFLIYTNATEMFNGEGAWTEMGDGDG